MQFLDAVSLLHRWDVQQAKALWGAWWAKATAESAFEELERRSLVSVVYDDGVERLQTHDVVRSLGAGILRDSARANCYYGSRLWSRGGSVFLDWSKVRALEQLGAFTTTSFSVWENRPARLAHSLHPQERCVPLVAVVIEEPIETRPELHDMDLGHLRMLRVRGEQVGWAVS